jgi:hypothetical protein
MSIVSKRGFSTSVFCASKKLTTQERMAKWPKLNLEDVEIITLQPGEVVPARLPNGKRLLGGSYYQLIFGMV